MNIPIHKDEHPSLFLAILSTGIYKKIEKSEESQSAYESLQQLKFTFGRKDLK